MMQSYSYIKPNYKFNLIQMNVEIWIHYFTDSKIPQSILLLVKHCTWGLQSYKFIGTQEL